MSSDLCHGKKLDLQKGTKTLEKIYLFVIVGDRSITGITVDLSFWAGRSYMIPHGPTLNHLTALVRAGLEPKRAHFLMSLKF